MIETIAWLIVMPLAFSHAYLGAETWLGLRPLRFDRDGDAAAPPRLALLIPAHNEGAGIAETVHMLANEAPEARILVVADNCTDDTALLAAQAGADVAMRNDPDRRGKGYALAFGRDELALAPPDAVIIVDADCRLDGNSATRLAARAIATGRPVQAANLLTSPDAASPLVAVSNFAMLVKNLVRARGLMRLGGGAMLFGTGMAFHWPLFVRLPLATDDAVEDLNLGLWLARQGVRVDLEDRALVTSGAAPVEASRAQRSRWEHGFLRTAASEGVPLVLRGIGTASRNLATLGAHLLVPPLALLMLLSLVGLAAIAALGAASGNWIPLLLGSAAFAFSGAGLCAAWWRYGRAILPFASLLRVPFYILWKIPIYLGFFTRNQKHWNRTTREGERN
ncbi:MAG: glycosyltransferase [Sphingomonadales bacterium]|nr:MAG: glycosyltransferase [Sphingomonadales bacterium]